MEGNGHDEGFVLEVTRFTPALATETLPVPALADFDDTVRRYEAEPELVFGLVCDGGAGGAFYLFINGDRGWIHLTAGSCHTAHGRVEPQSVEPVVFRLDTGRRQAVPADQTVSRQEGLRALRHWFCTEKPWPELDWIEE
jgi:hypothetical protein